VSSEHESALGAIDRRAFIGRGITGAAAVTLPGLIAACGGGSTVTTGTPATKAPAPPGAPTGVLQPVFGVIDSIDPALSRDGWETYRANVYDGLLSHSPKGELVPALATKYESSADATEWTLTLREGVKFHDGADLDATAVLRTIEHYYAVSPAVTELGLPPKASAVELDDSDPGVFKVKSKTPLPDFGRNLPLWAIISPKLLAGGKAAPTKTMVGTGPFRFVEYTKGQSLTMEANPDYWGDGPYLERVEFSLVTDPSAQLAALRSKSADMVFSVSPEQVPQLNSSEVQVATTDAPLAVVFVFLQRDGRPISNPEVRQAIAHAIDRQALIDKVVLGAGKPLDSFVPAGVYGAITPKATYPFDPERAKQLISDAGLEAGDVLVKMATSDVLTPRNRLLAQAINQMLQDVGISSSVDDVDPTEFAKLFDPKPPWETIQGDLEWNSLGPLFITNGYLNELFAEWKSPEYDALVEKIRTTGDGPEREQAIADAQELIAKELPAITLYQRQYTAATQSDVYGWSNPADGSTIRLGGVYRGKA